MTDFDQFERRLAAALRSDADASVDPFEAGQIARAAIAGPRPTRRFGRGRGFTLLAAAALLVGGALAAGSGFVRLPSVVPPVPDPSVIAVATASPDATFPSPSESAAPSATPSASPIPIDCAVPPQGPSEPTGPLAWTPQNLKGDWPAPVRPEPAGDGTVQSVPLTYLDPIGDSGSTAFPCADIRGVMADTDSVRLQLDLGQQIADPIDRWIAYGVVTDDDRDGVADWRYGIDNTPATALKEVWPGDSRARWWRTNLHTGRTDWGQIAPWDAEEWFDAVVKAEYPDETGHVEFRFRAVTESAGGPTQWGFELDMPFYTWASVIRDGRVVAADYAPDSGWLVAKQGVRPGGTLLLGTPFPELSLTVPKGWLLSLESWSGTAGQLRRVACGDRRRDDPPAWAYNADCALVRFDVMDNPHGECAHGDKPEDSSFDGLVTLVAGLPRTTRTEDVTVDGYPGKHFERSPRENESTICVVSGYTDVWILDVDGVPLIIGSRAGGALAMPVPEEALKAEIQQMVESIHFER